MIKVIPYQPSLRTTWDDLVKRSASPNILMFRDYIEYHANRFDEHSLVLYKDEKPIGVFPAATNPNNMDEIVSHPGLTFGGVMLAHNLNQDYTLEFIQEILHYYRNLEFKRIIYKSMPQIYSKKPNEQAEYFLWKLDFLCSRLDLSVSIDLQNENPWSSRRIRALKKASKSVTISHDLEYLNDFWEILSVNLKTKHGAIPTHSLSEMQFLLAKFPSNILPTFALIDGSCVGGVINYTSERVHHAQYISTNELGSRNGALEAIFESAIEFAISSGATYYDFGISTTDSGNYLNLGLYTFKTEFGGGGVCHRFYSREL